MPRTRSSGPIAAPEPSDPARVLLRRSSRLSGEGVNPQEEVCTRYYFIIITLVFTHAHTL